MNKTLLNIYKELDETNTYDDLLEYERYLEEMRDSECFGFYANTDGL